jgi:TonB dependent receptor
VQTANTPGDLGRLPGANVSLTSRSGSNELHGSLVYRFRHEALAANDWFANYSGSGGAPLRLHDIAPSIGGPVRRNHTFFFASFQHMSLRGPYVSRQPVPSLETRAAAPDWIRPALDLYPEPNGASLGNGLSAWYGRNIRPSQLDSGVARVDHALTARSTLFARYNDSPSTNQFGSTQINRLDLRFRSLTLGLNYRLGARLTFDVRANESQSEASSTWSRIGQTTSGCDLEPVTSYLFSNVAGACNDLLRLSIGGVGQVVNGREGDRRQRQFQLVESTGLTLGAHTIRLGVDYRRIVPIRRDANGALAVIADDITAVTDKRNLWLGTAEPVNGSTEVTELSLWVQDTWQISPRVTITPGLRWEYNPPPVSSDAPWFLDPATNIFNHEQRPLWPVSYNNFAPRLSAVWRVTRSGNTVLRGGGGIFYDSSLSIATDLINSGPLGINQLISGKAGLFSSVLSYGFDPGLRLPRLAQWNLTLDRALGRNDAVSIGYVGSKGRRLIRRELGGLGNTPTQVFALTTNHGSSDYEGLQVQYRRRVARGVQALASYSWSHSLDNDSSDSFLVWAAAGATASRDHASSDFDLRHSFTSSVTWDAPRRFGGWSLDSVLRARSGFPITVLVNEQYQGLPMANAFRPDQLLNQPVWIDDPGMPGGRRINAAAFVAPAAGKQGSLGRNSISGFGMSQIDLAVRREWKWRERRNIEVRLEAFNALNQPNFADPVHYLSSPVFGQSTSMLNLMLGTGSPGSGLSPLLQTGGARSMQGTLRFRF